MSKASLETYERIKSEGTLSKRRFEVYTALYLMEQNHELRETGPTNNEIYQHLITLFKFPPEYRHNTVARLCELESMGVVERTGDMECPVTGYCATTWRTVDRQPKPIEKLPKASMESRLERIVNALMEDSERWRNQKEDPHNMNYVLSVALRSVAMAIQKSL